MSVFFNLASIVFGTAACVLPVLAMKRQIDGKTVGANYFLTSFAACGISLCCVLFEIKHRIAIQDWTALMDTIQSYTGIAVVLVMITVCLNLVSIKMCFES